MTDNRTSEAFEFYLGEFDKDSVEQGVHCPNNELWAIAAKYQRMTEDIQSALAMLSGDADRRKIANFLQETLDFDPLSP